MVTSQMPIRIALADDHPIFLDGLVQLFRAEPDLEVVARCVDGQETLQAVRQLEPDVLVLDLRMPHGDGLEVMRQLQKIGGPTRVVLLSANLDEDSALEAIRLGARGLVLKEMAPRLLLQCIRKVHAGERWLETRSVSLAIDRLLRREQGSQRAEQLLSRREVEIARMVANGAANKEIARQLAITEGTVKVHLHKIYLKLGVANRLALARWVEGQGLA
jgi:DNA-binding NarL/FixJ family response regulator